MCALLLAGCTGPTLTIRELGQPAFEPLLQEQRFARVPDHEEQLGGFDVYDPDTAQLGEDHRVGLRFWPLADETTVAIEIRARSFGPIKLRDIAAAVYPATRSECAAFGNTGKLPAAKPVFVSHASEPAKIGRVLTLMFPLGDLPPGTLSLAVPILLRFEDNWVRLQYYKTAVPEPLRRRTPEEAEAEAEAEAVRAAEAAKKADPSGTAEPGGSSPATHAAEPEDQGTK